MDHVRAELQYAKIRTQHTILPFVRRWRQDKWYTREKQEEMTRDKG